MVQMTIFYLPLLLPCFSAMSLNFQGLENFLNQNGQKILKPGSVAGIEISSPDTKMDHDQMDVASLGRSFQHEKPNFAAVAGHRLQSAQVAYNLFEIYKTLDEFEQKINRIGSEIGLDRKLVDLGKKKTGIPTHLKKKSKKVRGDAIARTEDASKESIWNLSEIPVVTM